MIFPGAQHPSNPNELFCCIGMFLQARTLKFLNKKLVSKNCKWCTHGSSHTAGACFTTNDSSCSFEASLCAVHRNK